MLAAKMSDVAESPPDPQKPIVKVVRRERGDGDVAFRFSRQRYQQMAEAGIFQPEDKVELLNGLVVKMSPQGYNHAHAIRKLTMLFAALVADVAEVAIQLPFGAGADSEPEPDLYLIARGESSERHPERALLVVEVAATSLLTDRTIKGAIYAQAGVSDYWIVDVNAKVVEVYRQPRGDHYGAMFTATLDDRIELLELPGRFVAVADIFR